MSTGEAKYPETLADRLAELTSVREQLIAELNKPEPENAAEGRWSTLEIGYHLHLTENLITYMLTEILNGERAERASNEALQAEYHRLSNLITSRTHKVDAPGMLAPKNPPSLAETLELLNKSRAALVETISKYSIDDLASISAPHPIKEVGPITGAGWISLIGCHEMRHIAQIREMRN